MTCGPGVCYFHAVTPMDFLRRHNAISWCDSGGTIGVVGWFSWRLSNRIASCDNGCGQLLFCTLAHFACFRGNLDFCGSWVTTLGCCTCSMPCCGTGGWFSSGGWHWFSNIYVSFSNASAVCFLLAANGASGAGLRRSCISRRAKSTATCLADVCGYLPLCGKNLTICVMHSARILGT